MILTEQNGPVYEHTEFKDEMEKSCKCAPNKSLLFLPIFSSFEYGLYGQKPDL
jgi:hypothetical protein